MFYKKIKRFYDLFLAVLGIIFLSPVFLVIILAIKLDSRGPVFFRQKRIGKNKVLFNILKFRTMRIDTPSNTPTHLLENPKKWITRVGKILRKTSFDEIPQFFNIIKGDMSFIGPRPALWNQYDLIEERDKYNVNELTPGVSGWAQVNGRDELLISEKAKLDGIYVKKIGLITDIKLIIKTFLIVIKSDGNVEGTHVIKNVGENENEKENLDN